MKINDLLHESGLKVADFQLKNNHYWKNLLNLIADDKEIPLTDAPGIRVANPISVVNKLKRIWTGNKLATPEQVALLKKVKIPAVDGREVLLSKIFKSEEIKSTGDTGDEKSLTKFWNFGNIVEGIMGAAVTAKFINHNREITWKDVVAVLKQLSTKGITEKTKTVSQLVPYSMSAEVSNDSITFTLSLSSLDFKALRMSYQDPETLQTYPKHEEIFKAYADAANYANTSNTVKTAIDRVQTDPRNNQVLIESEGANHEKQTSTKADLFITIDGKKERLLSLKSKTTPQVGQVSGHAFENLEKFFKSTLGFGLPKDFISMFPKGSFNDVGSDIVNKAFPKAYKHMFKELGNTLRGNTDYVEYDFVKQIYSAIQHHATLGEDVIIVYLSPSAKKAYTEIKIGPELLEALKEFDLYPVLAGPTTIKIMGRPITELGKQIAGGRDQEFIQLRSYAQKGSTVRNIIEIKSLLKSLADVEGIKEREIQQKQLKSKNELAAVKKNAGLKNQPM